METVLFMLPGLLLQQAAGVEMTTGGWVFLIAAWVSILWLTFYTFSKVLTGKK